MELLVVQVQLVRQVQAVHLVMQEPLEDLIHQVVQVQQDHSVQQEMLVLLATQTLLEQAVQEVQTEQQVMLVTAVNHLLPVLLVVQDQQEHRD